VEEHEDRARWSSLDWVARTCLPAWLDLAGLPADAEKLRAIEPLTDAAAFGRQTGRLWAIASEAIYVSCWVDRGELTAPAVVEYVKRHAGLMSGTTQAGTLAPRVRHQRIGGDWSLGVAAGAVIEHLAAEATAALPDPGGPAGALREAWDRVLPVVLALRMTSPAEVPMDQPLTTAEVTQDWTRSRQAHEERGR
jgi:hypothetical protein